MNPRSFKYLAQILALRSIVKTGQARTSEDVMLRLLHTGFIESFEEVGSGGNNVSTYESYYMGRVYNAIPTEKAFVEMI